MKNGLKNWLSKPILSTHSQKAIAWTLSAWSRRRPTVDLKRREDQNDLPSFDFYFSIK